MTPEINKKGILAKKVMEDSKANQIRISAPEPESFIREAMKSGAMASMGTLSTIDYIDKSIKNFDVVLTNQETLSAQFDDTIRKYFPSAQVTIDVKKHFVNTLDELVQEKESELSDYDTTVSNYEKIINDPKVEEPKIQKFFEDNPLLLDRKITKLYSQKSFGGEKFPDFFTIMHDGTHILVEIEKPQCSLYTKKGNPSSDFSHAEEQVREYLAWAKENMEFLRKRGLPKLSSENMKGLLGIGMKANLTESEKEKLEVHNFSVRHSHEIKTFDDILGDNLQTIQIIRKHLKKCKK